MGCVEDATVIDRPRRALGERYAWQAKVRALWDGWQAVRGRSLPGGALRMVVGVSAGGGKTMTARAIEAEADEVGARVTRLLGTEPADLNLPHLPSQPAAVVCDASGGRPGQEVRTVRAAVQRWPTVPLLVLTYPEHVDAVVGVLRAHGTSYLDGAGVTRNTADDYFSLTSQCHAIDSLARGIHETAVSLRRHVTGALEIVPTSITCYAPSTYTWVDASPEALAKWLARDWPSGRYLNGGVRAWAARHFPEWEHRVVWEDSKGWRLWRVGEGLRLTEPDDTTWAWWDAAPVDGYILAHYIAGVVAGVEGERRQYDCERAALACVDELLGALRRHGFEGDGGWAA